jgi:hypothetical protein
LCASLKGKSYFLQPPKYGWKGTGRVTEVQCVRDVLMLHAKGGMHGTEIDRLARGERRVKVLQGQGAIAGTSTFIHKSGQAHCSLDSLGHDDPSIHEVESGA